MYEVVQELGDNEYHMYNKKKGKVEIIQTDNKLVIGKLYNIKQLKKKE